MKKFLAIALALVMICSLSVTAFAEEEAPDAASMLSDAFIDPLADWEPVTMEALVSMGRYDDARRRVRKISRRL